MRNLRPAAVLGALLLCSTVGAARAQLALGEDPRVDGDRFEVSRFAAGLSFPYGMVALDDGSLLVATSSTTPTVGTYWNAAGKIVRLVDADDDGLADAAPSVVYSGLPARPTSLARMGDLVVVVTATETQGRLSFLRLGATPSSPLTLAGKIDLGYVNHVYHQTYAVAVRPSATPDTWEVYFNLGSAQNATATPTPVTVGGLVTGSLAADSLARVLISDDGAALTATGLTLVATGLRNAAGLAFDPRSGDLWLEDNGIDSTLDPNEPLSADELNVIDVDELGGPAVNFGFPSDYIAYRTGARVGSGGRSPELAIQPWPDPMTGAEAEGPAQISFGPPGFPPPFDRGVFIGFHGRYTTAGPTNNENAVVFYDPEERRYLHFVPPALPGLGHPDALLAHGDSLYIADFSSNGGFSGASGVIYRVRSRVTTTCDPAPVCAESWRATIAYATVIGPNGLASIRCFRTPDGQVSCDTDANGRLALGPPMCSP